MRQYLEDVQMNKVLIYCRYLRLEAIHYRLSKDFLSSLQTIKKEANLIRYIYGDASRDYIDILKEILIVYAESEKNPKVQKIEKLIETLFISCVNCNLNNHEIKALEIDRILQYYQRI